MEIKCQKCQGKGYVKGENGVHTCWDCLLSGKFDTLKETEKR